MKKILIVEDHALFRNALGQFIRMITPNSLICMTETVKEGLDFIQLNATDVALVITDWNLPDGLGRAIIEETRKRSIPSILTSTDNEPTNHGANLFIPKMELDLHMSHAIQQLLET